MNEYLQKELIREEKRILKARDAEAECSELRATLNNVLVPVHAVLDEMAHDQKEDTEDLAITVLQETRARMNDLVGPETLRTGAEPEVPRARDTEPCNMSFED